MIITWFYATSTLDTKENCFHKNRGNSCCKHAEFINVWYDYIRYIYGKNEHIYIIDNGGPIKFQDIFFNKEDFDVLSIDNYEYDPNKFLHVKRFDEKLNHGGGVVRATWESWKFILKNNLDLYIHEADSLCTINLHNELKGNDIITINIEHGDNGCIDCSTWAFRKEILNEKMLIPNCFGYSELSVFDSLDQSIKNEGICCSQPNNQYYGAVEHGPYKNFKHLRMKRIYGDWIHDCSESQLKDFILRNNEKVASEYAIEYINKL